MSKDELIILIFKALPHNKCIGQIDTVSEEDAIQFNWRGTVYYVSLNLEAYEVIDTMHHGSDKAILMRSLLQKSKILMNV